jgi:16S rRNA processing protein RimM
VNSEGVELGRVDSLFETGANDVLVVQGERQRLIPFTRQTVLTVDLASGRVTVDWDPDF